MKHSCFILSSALPLPRYLRLLFMALICGASLVATPFVQAQFQFSPPVTYDVVSQPSAIAVADLNGDGLPDVIIGTDFGIAVLINKGDGTFVQPPGLYSVSVGQGGVLAGDIWLVAADLNGDGRPDVAVAGGGGVAVLLNNGNGVFAAPVYYQTGKGLIQTSLTYGDFFKDGHNHLAVTEVGFFGCCSTLTVFKNQGDGTFVKTFQRGLSGGAVSVISADVNNDGYPDLITANGNTNGPPTVSVLINRKDGTFADPIDYPANGTRQVRAADLNHDGSVDLVLNGIGVLLNNGDGTFAPAKYYSAPGSGNIAIADFDLDGNLDVAASAGAKISILRNNGDGTFGLPIIVEAGGRSNLAIAAGDFDANGDADLVVGDNAQNPAAHAIHVVLNQKLPPVDLGLRLSIDHGGNSGSVTLTIFGNSIPSGSTAELVCSGQPDLLATDNTVAPNGGGLSAKFNLIGSTPGQCSVVIVKPDGSKSIVPKLFTIEQGGAPAVWVDLLGFQRIRAGRPQEFYLVYGNSGQIDARSSAFWIAFPQFISWSIGSGITPDGIDSIDGDTVLTFHTGGLSASSVSPAIMLNLLVPDSPEHAHQQFEIRTWQ